ncbi:hypothetical protein [Polaromonas sp. CG9_12]|nr:hypothetical protein [Polaromonas sp. CG9_12]
MLLPVTMDPLPPASAIIELPMPAPAVRASPARAAAAGVIEIEVGGARVRLRGSVDAASVRCVLQALRDAS